MQCRTPYQAVLMGRNWKRAQPQGPAPRQFLTRQRFFGWIQWQRRILVRWEYHANNFLGFVQLACLVVLLKRF
jgi:hypothetical protein